MNKRINFIDFFRGVTVISMIAFHAVWDIVYVFGLKLDWYDDMAGTLWQQSICQSFILLSGLCTRLGKNTAKRGAVVFAAGLVVTAVSLMLDKQEHIIFGILTFLGSAMLFTAVFSPLLKKIQPHFGCTVSYVLFWLTFSVHHGYLGTKKMGITLPDFLYCNYLSTFFGFMKKGFYSADYFAFLPWIFLFLTGFFAFDVIGGRKTLEKLPDVYFAPVNTVGRYALVVYMLHQPVVYGIVLLAKSFK